jgi:hypothetical protein
MVAGPVLGGLMGGFSPHAPFFAAAALNGLNFLTGCFLLPESHKGERRPLRREALNPLASFRWARGMTVVAAERSGAASSKNCRAVNFCGGVCRGIKASRWTRTSWRV